MASVDILLPGYPLRTTRGNLSYCSVVLVEDEGKRILVDTGHFTDRPHLRGALASRGLTTDDIDIVVLTHLHFDHCVNAKLFTRSRVLVSAAEIEYARAPAAHDPYVYDFWRELLDGLRTDVVRDEIPLTGSVRLMLTPGHTPGSMCVAADTDKGVFLITGDTAKSTKEFLNREFVLAACPPDVCARSVDRILRTADYIIPGHDRVLKVVDGHVTLEDVRSVHGFGWEMY